MTTLGIGDWEWGKDWVSWRGEGSGIGEGEGLEFGEGEGFGIVMGEGLGTREGGLASSITLIRVMKDTGLQWMFSVRLVLV